MAIRLWLTLGVVCLVAGATGSRVTILKPAPFETLPVLMEYDFEVLVEGLPSRGPAHELYLTMNGHEVSGGPAADGVTVFNVGRLPVNSTFAATIEVRGEDQAPLASSGVVFYVVDSAAPRAMDRGTVQVDVHVEAARVALLERARPGAVVLDCSPAGGRPVGMLDEFELVHWVADAAACANGTWWSSPPPLLAGPATLDPEVSAVLALNLYPKDLTGPAAPDLSRLLREWRSLAAPVVLSYHIRGAKRDLGAKNPTNAITRAADRALFTVAAQSKHGNHVVLTLTPRSPVVVTLSHYTIENFGDRLGFHLINEVLPADWEVWHASYGACFEEGTAKKLDTNYMCIHEMPEARPDLFILGLGNSVFNRTMTPELFRLMDTATYRVGIFGTQYHELIDRDTMGRLLDRLDIWYARYGDDVRRYGQGRHNVVHLGDWLISACPMTQWKQDEVYVADKDKMYDEQPLDRYIQFMQRYRRVWSHRLHFLLCTLPSAQYVAYVEQREMGSTGVRSRKFRAMLIDIFGMEYPEGKYFEVDRAAVARYKTRVQRRMAGMRSEISALLGVVHRHRVHDPQTGAEEIITAREDW